MMKEFIEYKVGNSRTVYKKSSIDNLDTVGCWKFIDEFIDRNPKLSKASDSGYIYFLKASKDMEELGSECLIGKEIIGFCDSDFLSDFELNSMDLNSSDVLSYVYHGNLSVEALFSAEKLIRAEVSYLPMWRIRVTDDSEQLIHLEFWKS